MSKHERITQVAIERIARFLSKSLICSFLGKKRSDSLRKPMSEFPALYFSLILYLFTEPPYCITFSLFLLFYRIISLTHLIFTLQYFLSFCIYLSNMFYLFFISSILYIYISVLFPYHFLMYINLFLFQCQ